MVKRLNGFFDAVPELYEVKFSPSGAVMGRNQTLVELTAADALAAGKPVSAATEDAAKAIRSALVGLAFHLWEGR
ncbi:MAG: hypothetical protein C4320_03525 [Armatimonadota bacterium]